VLTEVAGDQQSAAGHDEGVVVALALAAGVALDGGL